MSSLLNEAIVDAKALREAALKNAETSVIEKYSEEVKRPSTTCWSKMVLLQLWELSLQPKLQLVFQD